MNLTDEKIWLESRDSLVFIEIISYIYISVKSEELSLAAPLHGKTSTLGYIDGNIYEGKLKLAVRGPLQALRLLPQHAL